MLSNSLMAAVGFGIIVLMATSIYRIKTTSVSLTERTTNFNVLYLQLAMIVIAFIAVVGSYLGQLWIDIKYWQDTKASDTAYAYRYADIKAMEGLLIFFVSAILLYTFGLYQRTDLQKEDLIQDSKSNLSSKSRVNFSSEQSSPMNSFGSKPSNNSLLDRPASGNDPHFGSDPEVRDQTIISDDTKYVRSTGHSNLSNDEDALDADLTQ